MSTEQHPLSNRVIISVKLRIFVCVDAFQSHLLRPHRLKETVVFSFGYAMAIDATNDIIPFFFLLGFFAAFNNNSHYANDYTNLTSEEFLI